MLMRWHPPPACGRVNPQANARAARSRELGLELPLDDELGDERDQREAREHAGHRHGGRLPISWNSFSTRSGIVSVAPAMCPLTT